MPIGEFGGAPPLVAEGSPALTTPMYWVYEMAQASLNPARAVTDATRILFQNPLNPLSHTEFGKSVAAGCEVFERTCRCRPRRRCPRRHARAGPAGEGRRQ
jgi:poly(3-hydroxybutyrate) depolymerase